MPFLYRATAWVMDWFWKLRKLGLFVLVLVLSQAGGSASPACRVEVTPSSLQAFPNVWNGTLVVKSTIEDGSARAVLALVDEVGEVTRADWEHPARTTWTRWRLHLEAGDYELVLRTERCEARAPVVVR